MQPTEEEKPVDVVVYDTVGIKLAQSLEGTGRSRYTPMQLQERVQLAVWRKWGTQAKRFQDENNGGWLVEVSEVVDGIESYAVIRSIHGTRMVTAVVNIEEVQQFEQSGKWDTPEANGLDEDLVMAMAEIEGNPPPVPGRPGLPTRPISANGVETAPELAPDPEDPRLVVWCEAPKGGGDVPYKKGGGNVPCLKTQYTTVSEVQNVVLKLLMKGHEVEVWSTCKKPQITVSL